MTDEQKNLATQLLESSQESVGDSNRDLTKEKLMPLFRSLESNFDNRKKELDKYNVKERPLNDSGISDKDYEILLLRELVRLCQHALDGWTSMNLEIPNQTPAFDKFFRGATTQSLQNAALQDVAILLGQIYGECRFYPSKYSLYAENGIVEILRRYDIPRTPTLERLADFQRKFKNEFFAEIVLKKLEAQGLPNKLQQIEGTISNWNQGLEAKEKKVEELKQFLEALEGKYHVDVLAKGFEGFKQDKIIGLRWARFFLGLFAIALIAVPICSYLWLSPKLDATNYAKGEIFGKLVRELVNAGQTKAAAELLQGVGGLQGLVSPLEFFMHALPIAALELVLLYFFRLSLQYYKNLKAQLLQIGLRQALLGFIQPWIAFSKGVDVKKIEKFETLIFSGIAADDEKVPTSFDGLAELIKQVRGE